MFSPVFILFWGSPRPAKKRRQRVIDILYKNETVFNCFLLQHFQRPNHYISKRCKARYPTVHGRLQP
ncbi:hypothetical protein [Pseudomonas sp. NPDC086278]|uniref:hypothetical protein n=1 Tax=Pseudomonas sp. NPDC086278 TaxID=3390646 RepID=UPI003D07FF76